MLNQNKTSFPVKKICHFRHCSHHLLVPKSHCPSGGWVAYLRGCQSVREIFSSWRLVLLDERIHPLHLGLKTYIYIYMIPLTCFPRHGQMAKFCQVGLKHLWHSHRDQVLDESTLLILLNQSKVKSHSPQMVVVGRWRMNLGGLEIKTANK